MFARALLVGILLLAGLPQEARKTARYGEVVIRPVNAVAGRTDGESQMEFLDTKGTRLCVIDYSSKDSQHGYQVVKAEWTRDQRFFVWSLQSSGGHSPWHFPTRVFAVRTTRVYVLDDLVPGPGISRGDFQLTGQNTFRSQAYEDQRPFIMKLEQLEKLSLSGNEFHCKGGQTMNFGEPD